MNNDAMYVVRTEDDDARKLHVMLQCDDAFQPPVAEKPDFQEICQKIARYAVFLVAEESTSREPVGYAAMYANDLTSRTAYITLICVRECAQGKHVGSMLLKECFSRARQNGMEQIRLEVLDNNANAIRFYQHHGFVMEPVGSGHGSGYMSKEL